MIPKIHEGVVGGDHCLLVVRGRRDLDGVEDGAVAGGRLLVEWPGVRVGEDVGHPGRGGHEPAGGARCGWARHHGPK